MTVEREATPDMVKISEKEARLILTQRLLRLREVGIADSGSQQRAAQTLWPRLFERAGAGALDPC